MENIFQTPAVSLSQLRVIPDTENFKRKDEYLGGQKVRVTYAIRADADAPRYEKSTTFDFSGVSEEQLLLLCCTNGVVVWVQRMLRDLGDGLKNPSNYTEVNVLEDIIEGPARVVVDPKVRAQRAVARLTPEARAELLEQLMSETVS